jgi:translation initiation factor 2A
VGESLLPLKWTGDEKYACRMTSTGLTIYTGDTITPVETSCRIPNAAQFWVSPAPAPGKAPTAVTFSPRTKSGPANVSLWSLPPGPAPISSRSLQSDHCRIEYACDGSAVLIELSTATSASSYYGDSRLFLLSVDGKVSASVAQTKPGPVADFAWSPTDPKTFIVIAGSSPPVAELHLMPSGAATFSFGTGGFNSIRFQPQGRMVMFAGLGNMSGDVQIWDLAKCKALSPVFNTPCATYVAWAPDGRTILAATTRPRLLVDNGWRAWSYKGQLLQHIKIDALFDALWRPAIADAPFPDRPPSPVRSKDKAAAVTTTDSSSTTMGLASAPRAKSGAYVPPHLRGSNSGVSEVVALMSEGHTRAGKVGEAAKAVTAPVIKQNVIPGMNPEDVKVKKPRKKKNKNTSGNATTTTAADEDDDD